MLLVTYGYQVKRDEEDDVLDSSFEMIEDFADATLPGAFLVDIIPACTSMLLVTDFSQLNEDF